MSLDSWSRIIAKQGEARRKEQEDNLKTLRKSLPAKIAEFKTMSDRELLRHFEEYGRRQFGYDPREAKLWRKIVQAARKEILNRMV